MDYKPTQSQPIIPRLIIHGGAGNILPSNLTPEKYKLYHDSLLRILAESHHFLTSKSCFPLSNSNSTYDSDKSDTSSNTNTKTVSALDAVTFAMSLLEDNPLFNSGHGAVFTRDGVNELEASIMVSKGLKKRGVGVMGIQHVKNPIKLAREMLVRGEQDLVGGNGRAVSGGAQGHSQLHQYSAEKLAREWGLECVEPSYYFTQGRWDEHIRGLEKEKAGGVATWDEEHFFPQGTCGAVALDGEGVLAVATSTGGMTNKLTGRIGDTPTLGAGFWAEEWEEEFTSKSRVESMLSQSGPALIMSDALTGLITDCLPNPMAYSPLPKQDIDPEYLSVGDRVFRSSAMSGTGNGDSFLRINACRTASAIARYTGAKSNQKTSLQDAVTEIAGPGGELVKSAGERWQKTGEGEGGIIGIELTIIIGANGEKKVVDSQIVDDFNCGGMFRAAVDPDNGKAVMRAWKPGQHEGIERYEGEGREYDLRDWLDEKVLD
ncbi:hypothetical protein HYALB_00011475 [Hymenoscyphus albidus]|uniref:N-terminal nucleophile aminohydrolase n=1 Tax=Hymenoscyphus albidus TaxID=595503 RepID=A0A9N9LHP7_9HELO|nr:hypothetical protein HYALB_00011475 [Hymenoscyphus albidus]